MDRRMKLLCVLCVWATASAYSADFSLFGWSRASRGDKGRRDDQDAFRQGAEASLAHRQQGLDLALAYRPTGEGSTQLWVTWGERLLLRASLSRWRRFSDDSAYPERTPLGTPVRDLYPFTNTLTPAFGRTEPVLDRDQVHVDLMYGSPRQGVAVALEALEQTGDRTLQAGAFAFGEGPSPAFFPASLATLASRQWRGEVSAWGELLGWNLKGQVGRGHGSSDLTGRYPVYGASQLLAVSSLRSKDDTRSSWAQAVADRHWEKAGLTLSMGLGRVENSPGFAGTEGSQLRTRLRSGRGENTSQVGAFALWAKPLPWLTVGLSGEAREEERKASGEVETGLVTFALSRWERSVAGVGLSLRARFRVASASLAGGRKWEDTGYRLGFGLIEQREKREAVKDWLRGEVTWRPSAGLRLRLRGDGRWEDHTLKLPEQTWGYAMGGRWEKWARGRAEASWSRGPWELGLVGERMRVRQLWQAPLFDPVYDPSWELLPSPAAVSQSHALVRAAFNGDGGTVVWGEAGYRSQKWNLDAVTFPGFSPVDEWISGWTASAGAAFTLTPRDQLQLAASFDQPRHTVAHKLQRAELTFAHAFNPRLELVLRGLYRNFNELRFKGDDYQLKALALGLRGTF